jgi:hypothetical protein
MGQKQVPGDFTRSQTLGQTEQDRSFARRQAVAQQTNGFANLDFSHNRLLDRCAFQAVAQILVLWQLDLQTSPSGGIDASPGP